MSESKLGSKKIVLLFSAGRESGFGRNAYQIAEGLYTQGWDITLLDRNEGITIRFDTKKIATIKSINDSASINFLANVVTEVAASIILLFTDFPDFEMYDEVLWKISPKPILIGYAPIDGELVGLPNAGALGKVDKLVVFTNDAKNEIERIVSSIPIETKWLDKWPTIIGHPFDSNKFFPIIKNNSNPASERLNEARKLLFTNQPNLQNSFIVLNGNGAWLRKCIHLTIEGFALFAKDKLDTVKLCLPTYWKNTKENVWIKQMVIENGIENRMVQAPVGYNETNRLTDYQLNLLYNACDVGINTAGGEGWGLVSFEHAATGAAQIVPGLAGMQEIWGEAPIYLQNTEPILMGNKYHWKVSTAVNIAETLEVLYSDKPNREQIGTACYHKVNEEQFKPENIAQQWNEYLLGLISEM